MTRTEIQSALKANAAALADIRREIAEERKTSVRFVRLHDRRHELEARNMMLCRMFDSAGRNDPR